LDVAEKLCDRVAVINKGKIVVDTSMSDLKALRRDETLEEYFLSITRTEGGEV
jgi:ABC-2 type transport system ATP-binding protein